MMTSFKKLTLGLSVAALAIGGVASAKAPAASPAATTAQTKDARVAPPRLMGDADGNGILTRAEAQSAAEAHFARMDVNKDGKLDRADHELARTQMRERHFERLDTDKNGTISKAEFLAERGPANGPRGPRPDGARPEGKAPEGQFRGHHGRWHKGGEHRGGERAGGEHRGLHHGRGHGGPFAGPGGPIAPAPQSITKAAFIENALKRFDAQDANRDGQVTQAERKAARDARMAERKAAREAARNAAGQTKTADKPAAN